MERYFMWLKESKYFKYVGNFHPVSEHIFIFRPIDNIQIYFKLWAVNIPAYNISIPFSTIEAAIEITQRTIDFMLEDRDHIHRQCEALFSQEIKGSGLTYAFVRNDDPKRKTNSECAYVKMGMSTIVFSFNEMTNKQSFEKMVHHALKYRDIYRKYTKYNCFVRL
ncbi:MAG: hypothetical protein IJX65_07015 [Alistipes sp.]|nr:hypothetical protein [Alistipes sp.]